MVNLFLLCSGNCSALLLLREEI
jgi:hypothetical protein